MAVRPDRTRIRSARLDRGWSQDQLSAVSGLSVRTIQRVEAGRAATRPSLSALAMALSLPEAALVTADGPVRRVTPLTVVDEIGPLRRLYTDLGFSVVATDAPGCIGLRGGRSRLILCTVAFLESEFRKTDFAPLVGQTLPYLWVRSLDAARAVYGSVWDEASLQAGIREVLVTHHGHWAILAETSP